MQMPIVPTFSASDASMGFLADGMLNDVDADDQAQKRRRLNVQMVGAYAYDEAIKRPREADDAFDQRKRQRFFNNQLVAPMLELPGVNEMVTPVCCVLEPYYHTGGGGNIVLYDGQQCRQLPLPTLHGMFANVQYFTSIHDGHIIAQIPPAWRAALKLSDQLTVVVAMLRIDIQGAIALLSSDGTLLAEVPAARMGHTTAGLIRIDLHGVQILPRESNDALLAAMCWTKQ